MNSCDQMKVEVEALQQLVVEAKKNAGADALKEVKRLCKECGFTAGTLKGSIVEGKKARSGI